MFVPKFKKNNHRMYYVIHSSNHYLLATLCVLLQMAGYKMYEGLTDLAFDKGVNWLSVDSDNTILFMPHGGIGEPVRLWATEKNYIEVLSEILNNKK